MRLGSRLVVSVPPPTVITNYTQHTTSTTTSNTTPTPPATSGRTISKIHMVEFGEVTSICSGLDFTRVQALERERKIHRNPAGNQAQDLSITSQMLLPLSHWWTHSRGAEADLHITAMPEASADSSCLSLSPLDTLLSFKWRSPGGWGCGPGVDWLYRHCICLDVSIWGLL